MLQDGQNALGVEKIRNTHLSFHSLSHKSKIYIAKNPLKMYVKLCVYVFV